MAAKTPSTQPNVRAPAAASPPSNSVTSPGSTGEMMPQPRMIRTSVRKMNRTAGSRPVAGRAADTPEAQGPTPALASLSPTKNGTRSIRRESFRFVPHFYAMSPALLRALVAWLLLLTAAVAQTGELRFSQSLKAEDRAEAGLTRLSSDEIAVIDALVRRDTGTRAGTAAGDQTPVSFSQRLSVSERGAAGLAKLNATELPKLDAFVARHQSARLARSLLAPPTYVTRPSRVTPTEKKKERQIHGSYSLSFGVGSGGYSEKSGSMMLTLDDPERGLSISVGYTETHTKGGYIYRDPFYDPLRGGPMDTVAPFRP